MVIEIDFQSDEAIYTQLMNQIIMGIATSALQEGDPLPICQAAGGYHWNKYAYCKQSLFFTAPGGLCFY